MNGSLDIPPASPPSRRRLGLVAGLLLLFALGAPSGGQVRKVSNPIANRDIFIVAHQDDWQLFMGDVASRILKAGLPARFVYLTAGDDGRDSLYWQTREHAALRSTAVAAGRINPELDEIQCSTVMVMEHAVRKCSLGDTESYFLRLPDGKRNGTGFARYSHQSMRSLRGKKIEAITTVDGAATYQGWPDLVATVEELVDAGGAGVVVHTTDPSIAANPHDHFDHRMAGLLVEDLRRRHPIGARYYAGYALATRAANRSNSEAREKTAIFLAYDAEMMRANKNWGAYREHPAFYAQCMARTYARSPRDR
ncbi:MAG TPA: PIG-L family deacetylase [Gemmatimonadaceae bacterium]|nr:PIG-L family deacetylase [Gemmatimonadaceae bacterium]